MCKHQQRFGLDVQCSALVLNFNNIFSNGHLYRAGQSMNSLPSQILERYAQAKGRQYVSASERTVAREAVKLLTVIVFAGVPLSVFFIAAFSNLLRE